MVRRGWGHATLMAMAEHDFQGWLDDQLAYDDAVAEARKRAVAEARNS